LSLGISPEQRLSGIRRWSPATPPLHRQRLWLSPTVAGLIAWGLAAVAAFEGQSLAFSEHPAEPRPWLILAALLGFIGIRLLEVQGRNTDAPEGIPVLTVGQRQRRGGLPMMALGGVYALVATALVQVRAPEGAATWVWLFGIAAAVVGAALVSGSTPWPIHWPSNRAAILEAGLLMAILGVAVWLRFPNLATVPPNLHGDEVSIGLDARRVLNGEMPAVFAVGWYEVPALSFTLHAATMGLFGDNLFGLRLASVIEGLLSIVLLFLLTRRLWGSRPALMSAAFMAVAAWHIHFSRTGFHYMQAPVATLLAIYFMIKAVQDRRILDWLLCGLAIGLSFEVYYAARIAALLVGAYLAYRAVTQRTFIREHAPGLAALAFGALIFLAPMAAVFAGSPASFSARTAGVLITSPDNLQHELGGYHVGTFPEVLAIQLQHTLEAFNIRGETSLQYGHPTPLLDFWTGGLLAMSATGILLRLGSSRGALLAGWVWLTLFVGSAMTVDALFSPRVLLALPALAIGAALVLERAWHGVTRLTGQAGTLAFTIPVLAIMGLALQANAHDYFDVQVVDRQPAGRFTVLANYAQTIAGRYRMYAIGREDWSLTNEPTRFLLPTADAVNVRNTDLAVPLAAIPADKGVAFLVENGVPDFDQRLGAIQRSYPNGRQTVLAQSSGNAVFTSYLVENADLVAANPSAARN
jgi:4-amino-4-deoxy-L-arabinose transferase-like glycosyltransferase